MIINKRVHSFANPSWFQYFLRNILNFSSGPDSAESELGRDSLTTTKSSQLFQHIRVGPHKQIVASKVRRTSTNSLENLTNCFFFALFLVWSLLSRSTQRVLTWRWRFSVRYGKYSRCVLSRRVFLFFDGRSRYAAFLSFGAAFGKKHRRFVSAVVGAVGHTSESRSTDRTFLKRPDGYSCNVKENSELNFVHKLTPRTRTSARLFFITVIHRA